MFLVVVLLSVLISLAVPRVGGSNVSLVAGGPAMFGRAFFFFVFGCGPAA